MIKNKILDTKSSFKIYLKTLKTRLTYFKFSNKILFYKTVLHKIFSKIVFRNCFKTGYRMGLIFSSLFIGLFFQFLTLDIYLAQSKSLMRSAPQLGQWISRNQFHRCSKAWSIDRIFKGFNVKLRMVEIFYKK